MALRPGVGPSTSAAGFTRKVNLVRFSELHESIPSPPKPISAQWLLSCVPDSDALVHRGGPTYGSEGLGAGSAIWAVMSLGPNCSRGSFGGGCTRTEPSEVALVLVDILLGPMCQTASRAQARRRPNRSGTARSAGRCTVRAIPLPGERPTTGIDTALPSSRPYETGRNEKAR